MTLIVDENPSPVVGSFNFSQKSGNASLTTRIRIDKYTYVRAIAETNDNKKYIAINDQIISAIEQVRSEQEFIAKAFGNEKKLSKAIELARIGTKADDITTQTGISADEAAVVVKFHGPK